MITRKVNHHKQQVLLLFFTTISSVTLFFILLNQPQVAYCDEPNSALASNSESSVSDHMVHSHDTSSNQDVNNQPGDQNDPSTYGDTSDGDGTPTYQPPAELQIIRLNDTSVVLRWDSDHLPLQHLQFFKVQYKSTKKDTTWKTDNHEIAPQVKAYQINGLRPGNYFFKVQAVYDNDDSVSSEQIKYKLRTKTKIPLNEWPEMKAPEIIWYEEKPDYLRFKWKYNFKNDDVGYFGYLVYYRSAYAMTDFTIYNTLDENVEIAELEPDTAYEVKIVAYNQHTVSEFSELKRVKTQPRANSTSTVAQSTTTPTPPIKSTTLTVTSTTRAPTLDLIKPPVDLVPPSVNQVTHKPTVINHIASNSTSSSPSILTALNDLFFGGQSDATTAIRYSLLVLLPIIFIVFASLCLISCRHNRHKDPQPSSTHDSMQFGLEISGYFKNSFPNVETEYLPPASQDTKHGFVNNHPHIHDYA